MLKRFFKGLKLHMQVPLTRLVVVLVSFAMGLCLMLFILLLDEGESWFPMGSLMALAGILIMAALGYLSYPQQFMLALSMGRTRKQFMISYALEELLWLTLSYGLVLLLSWLESRYRLILFPQSELGASLLPILTDFRVILTAIPVLALLEMFCGSLYSRFGKPFNVVMYVLWMSAALSMSKLVHMILPMLRGLAALWIPLDIIGMSVMVFVVIYLGINQGVR